MVLTIKELDARRARFCQTMQTAFPNWDTAVIISKVNQFYFTGTIQDAMLLIRKDGSYSYFVRKSHQRAVIESPLANIFEMHSYRDAAEKFGRELGHTYIEAETLPYAMMERLQKYFRMSSLSSLDHLVRTVRAVKSPLELHWMEYSGRQHHRLLAEEVPALLKEGISEADFVGAVFEKMMQLGYQGISRFYKYQTEIAAGQFGFGINSLYPTNFDGPGGAYGNSPGAPVGGSPSRKLKKGDLVFVDIGFGIGGYHSDKTQVYLFGAQPTEEMLQVHRGCMEVEQRTAEQLLPGAIPSQIYESMLTELPPSLQKHFMGYGDQCVKFLGHGVGLHIDELPVLAKGFDTPLEENMVISLEPKKGLDGIGMLGVEDTYIVTPHGGKCITGGGSDIIVI